MATSVNAAKREIEILEKEQKRIIDYIFAKKVEAKDADKEVSRMGVLLVEVNNRVEESKNLYNDIQANVVLASSSLVFNKKTLEKLDKKIKDSSRAYAESMKVYNTNLNEIKTTSRETLRELNRKESDGKSRVSRLDTAILNKGKNLIVLKKEVEDHGGTIKSGRQEIKYIETNIKNQKLDLETLDLQTKDKKAILVTGEKQNQVIKSETKELKKEFLQEEELLGKMTKKRIKIGQETQVLNQVKEEIKTAYERAGMKYPYGE